MKTAVKRIFLIVLALTMLFSLCSCFDLVSLRKSQAKWQEDGSIIWNGQTYKYIKASADFNLIDRTDTSLSLTEADVPLLLAEPFGSPAWLDGSGTFISFYATHAMEHVETSADEYDIVFFCREDRYEDVSQKMTSKDLEHFYAIAYESGENTALHFLSEEQSEAIKESLATSKNKITPNNLSDYYINSSNRGNVFELFRVSADGLFKDPEFYDESSLIYDSDNDRYIVSCRTGYGETTLWRISAQYDDLFKPLFEEFGEDAALLDAPGY